MNELRNLLSSVVHVMCEFLTDSLMIQNLFSSGSNNVESLVLFCLSAFHRLVYYFDGSSEVVNQTKLVIIQKVYCGGFSLS